MQDRISQKEYKPVLKSLLFSLLYIAFAVILGMSWETDDDPGIAYVLTMADNSFSPFQWRLLSIILRFLYVHLPIIDWWAANTVLALWLHVFAVVYVVFRRYPSRQAYPLNTAFIIISWMCTVHAMNFTRTAVAVAISGGLLIADSTLKSKQNNPLEFGFGCFLMLYGASIRNECALIALGYLAVLGGTWLLAQHFRLKASWFSCHKKQILGLCLAAAIVFSGFLVHKLALTPEQREFLTYNSLRGNIQDYADYYPMFEEKQGAYTRLGISKVMRDCLMSWFSEDTDVYTPQVLEAIGRLRIYPRPYGLLRWNVQLHQMQLNVFSVLCLIMLLKRKTNIFRFIPILFFTVMCCTVFASLGRLTSRLFMSFGLAMICSLVFIASCDDPIENTCAKSLSHFQGRFLPLIYCLGVIVLLVAMSGEWRQHIQQHKRPWNETRMTTHRAKTLDIIHEDADHLYFFDTSKRPASMGSSFSFWEPRPIGYCENYLGLGGWDARHPHRIAVLAERGISNPVRALFEREDAYCTYTERLHQYLRSVYHERIAVSEVFQINDVPIVHYTAPVDDSQLVHSEEASVILTDIHHVDDRNQPDIWYLSAEIQATGNRDGAFYCNITVDDARYTYRLKHEGEKVSAHIYGVDASFDPSDADIQIFEHTADGQYIQYVWADPPSSNP